MDHVPGTVGQWDSGDSGDSKNAWRNKNHNIIILIIIIIIIIIIILLFQKMFCLYANPLDVL